MDVLKLVTQTPVQMLRPRPEGQKPATFAALIDAAEQVTEKYILAAPGATPQSFEGCGRDAGNTAPSKNRILQQPSPVEPAVEEKR